MEVSLLGTQEIPEDVRSFLREEGNVFQSPEYLYLLNKESKYAIFRDEEGNLKATFPLSLSRKARIKGNFIPPYGHLYGPLLKDKNDLEAVISAIPKKWLGALNSIKLVLDDHDLLPLLKSKGIITPTQCHRVESTTSDLPATINSSKKRYLKKLLKLQESGEILLKEGKDCIDDLVHLQQQTAEKNNFNSSIELLERLIRHCPNDMSYSFVLYYKNEPIAGAWCPFDNRYAYHLVNASKDHSDSLINKANILCTYLSIQKALDLNLGFDFEGSNLPGVANFYRQMGGKPVIYYRVDWPQNWMGKMYTLLRIFR